MTPIVPMQAIVAQSAVERAVVVVAEKYSDHVEVAKYLVMEGQRGAEIVKLLKDDGIPFAYAVAAVKIVGGKI